MSLRRLTAPMRRVCHLEKEQHPRTEQFYPIVQLVAAWSELSMSSEEDKPEEDASSCDPDKESTERQVDDQKVRDQRRSRLQVATNHSIKYHRPMARNRIRLARSSDCRALAEMRYRFRAETQSVTETKSRFMRRCTSWMRKRFRSGSHPWRSQPRSTTSSAA